jgi:hypothetical protein
MSRLLLIEFHAGRLLPKRPQRPGCDYLVLLVSR